MLFVEGFPYGKGLFVEGFPYGRFFVKWCVILCNNNAFYRVLRTKPRKLEPGWGKQNMQKTSRFTWFLRKVGVTPCGLLSSRGLIGSPLFGAKNHVKRDVFAIFALSWAWLQLSLEFPILGLVAAFAWVSFIPTWFGPSTTLSSTTMQSHKRSFQETTPNKQKVETHKDTSNTKNLLWGWASSMNSFGGLCGGQGKKQKNKKTKKQTRFGLLLVFEVFVEDRAKTKKTKKQKTKPVLDYFWFLGSVGRPQQGLQKPKLV